MRETQWSQPNLTTPDGMPIFLYLEIDFDQFNLIAINRFWSKIVSKKSKIKKLIFLDWLIFFSLFLDFLSTFIVFWLCCCVFLWFLWIIIISWFLKVFDFQIFHSFFRKNRLNWNVEKSILNWFFEANFDWKSINWNKIGIPSRNIKVIIWATRML